ncbi:MAG: FAD-dependent oxidoreductase [Rhodobacteraceae bacterium]|nr:MAG: FAD-dependent oxidoreductase [Paracoccaceae bacterium]
MKVCVIGAGIIGASAALDLVRDGHAVTLLDRDGVAAGASQGNAGAFAFADVIPLATPGIMKKAPKWLLDPLGPLSVPPAYALTIAPWLIRYWRASWRDRYVAALKAQSDMMRLSQEALDALVADFNLSDLIRPEGQMQLYEGEAAFQVSQKGWDERRKAGVKFEFLTGPEAIAEIQPGIDPRFTHAGFTPEWKNVTDPAVWTRRIAEEAQRLGTTFARRDVTRIEPAEQGAVVHSEEGAERFDKVVLAAGAYGNPLLKTLGLKLPLETERGYNTTLPAGAFDLKTHLTFSDHGFVVTKIGEGVRVGGAVELGGMTLAPRMARAEALLTKAKRFLPTLDTEGGTQWMGFRPSMPDSLPVIGAHPDTSSVVFAFGHGHLGLTQSAGTARVVSDLIAGRTPSLDLTPFRPTRFAGYRA